MKRRNEVLVGILLTVGVVIAVLGTIWLVRGGFSSGYPLYARFKWGAGVKQGQAVRLAGVQIGVVSDVELDPRGTILVKITIEDDYHVPRNSTAAVQAVGIFGDQEIALIPKEPSPIFFNEGDSIPPAVPKPGLNELAARADTISQRLDDVAKAVQVELVQGGGIADLRKTLGATHDLTRQLGTIATEQSRQLTLTLGQFRKTTAALDSVQLDSTLRNLQKTTQNLSAFTDSLRGTATALNAVLAKADHGDGTLGKLMNDPGLYYDLRRLTTRLDSLTLDFKKNPRKYINLEIF
ncbi:MAG TPA: MlaD family protein [Gemmatimonadaceae bacterium]|nr:MlaD family protein [Gemmatimonadaceae bacterium]